MAGASTNTAEYSPTTEYNNKERAESKTPRLDFLSDYKLFDAADRFGRIKGSYGGIGKLVILTYPFDRGLIPLCNIEKALALFWIVNGDL